MYIVALDFETTGLDVENDEPIQIGIVEFNPQGEIVGGFNPWFVQKNHLKSSKVLWVLSLDFQ